MSSAAMMPYDDSNDAHMDDVRNMLFEWVDDMPRPVKGKAFIKEQVQQLFVAAAALEYRGEFDPMTHSYIIDDPRFVGKTNAEVMVMRDIDTATTKDGGRARERVMDRILGKPKQAVENVSVNVSYTEWLERMADENADYDPLRSVTAPSDYVIDIKPNDEDLLDEDLLDEDLLDGV